jgi:thiamine monophosphate kinase
VVGASLRLDDLPVDPAATMDDALGGGEDYELLATLPSIEAVDSAREELLETFGVPLTAIGSILEGRELVSEGSGGRTETLPVLGWDHFRP